MNRYFNYINFTEKSIENLIREAKSGKKISEEKLLSIIRDVAHSYFFSKYRLKKINEYDTIDDLTNDVCLAFHENLSKIENVENWLRKVLYFKFISFYKRTKNRQTFELNTAIHQSETIDGSVKIDAGIALEELNKFSEEKQKIIRQRFWEGLKFIEIAENLGKSEAAVKKMFYRTLEELKKKL